MARPSNVGIEFWKGIAYSARFEGKRRANILGICNKKKIKRERNDISHGWWKRCTHIDWRYVINELLLHNMEGRRLWHTQDLSISCNANLVKAMPRRYVYAFFPASQLRFFFLIGPVCLPAPATVHIISFPWQPCCVVFYLARLPSGLCESGPAFQPCASRSSRTLVLIIVGPRPSTRLSSSINMTVSFARVVEFDIY